MPAPDTAARLPAFAGAEEDVQARLQTMAVCVVGLGSVGLAAALHLARAGIGELRLVDRGSYKAESLLTHPLHPEAVGRPKAEYAGEAVRRLTGQTRVTVHQAAFATLPFEALLRDGRSVDLVLLAVDNLATEIEVAQRSLHLGIPLLQCSVGGSLLVAQLRSFTGGQAGEGACVACGYSPMEWRQLAEQASFSCDGSTAARAGVPTRSPSSLCSLAAELGVHRALRQFLGLGGAMRDELLEYRGYTDSLVATPLARDPGCPVDHRRFLVRPRGTDVRTIRAAVVKAGHDEPCSVAVDGARFVAAAACGGGTVQTVNRFAAPAEPVGPCCCCGGPLSPAPVFTRDAVLATAALADVALPADRAVVVSAGSGAATLFTPADLES